MKPIHETSLIRRYHLVIKGKPITQKNNLRCACIKGKPRMFPGKVSKDYHKMAIPQLQEQWGDSKPLDSELKIEIFSYCTTRQKPDVDNLAAAPLDCLEKAGVVTNDRLFYEANIKRRWDNDDPRVELWITEWASK
jgi:Holliday junction resolvase RusA-like endonuclease